MASSSRLAWQWMKDTEKDLGLSSSAVNNSKTFQKHDDGNSSKLNSSRYSRAKYDIDAHDEAIHRLKEQLAAEKQRLHALAEQNYSMKQARRSSSSTYASNSHRMPRSPHPTSVSSSRRARNTGPGESMRQSSSRRGSSLSAAKTPSKILQDSLTSRNDLKFADTHRRVSFDDGKRSRLGTNSSKNPVQTISRESSIESERSNDFDHRKGPLTPQDLYVQPSREQQYPRADQFQSPRLNDRQYYTGSFHQDNKGLHKMDSGALPSQDNKGLHNMDTGVLPSQDNRTVRNDDYKSQQIAQLTAENQQLQLLVDQAQRMAEDAQQENMLNKQRATQIDSEGLQIRFEELSGRYEQQSNIIQQLRMEKQSCEQKYHATLENLQDTKEMNETLRKQLKEVETLCTTQSEQLAKANQELYGAKRRCGQLQSELSQTREEFDIFKQNTANDSSKLSRRLKNAKQIIRINDDTMSKLYNYCRTIVSHLNKTVDREHTTSESTMFATIARKEEVETLLGQSTLKLSSSTIQVPSVHANENHAEQKDDMVELQETEIRATQLEKAAKMAMQFSEKISESYIESQQRESERVKQIHQTLQRMELLSNQLSDLQVANQTMRKELIDTKEAGRKQKEQLSKEESDKRRRQSEKASHEIVQLSKQLSEEQAITRRLENDINALKQQNDLLQQRSEVHYGQINELEKQIESRRNDISNKDDTILRLKEQSAADKTRIQSLEGKLSEVHEHLNRTQSEHRRANNMLEGLQTRLNEVERDLQMKTVELTDAVAAKSSIHQDSTQLQARLENITAQLTETERRCQEYQRQVNELQVDLKHARSDVQSIQPQVQELSRRREEVRRLREKIDTCTGEIETLSRRVKKLTAERDSFEEQLRMEEEQAIKKERIWKHQVHEVESDLKRSHQRLQHQIKMLTYDLNTKDEQLKACQAERDLRSRQLKDVESELSSRKLTIEALKREMRASLSMSRSLGRNSRHILHDISPAKLMPDTATQSKHTAHDNYNVVSSPTYPSTHTRRDQTPQNTHSLRAISPVEDTTYMYNASSETQVQNENRKDRSFNNSFHKQSQHRFPFERTHTFVQREKFMTNESDTQNLQENASDAVGIDSNVFISPSTRHEHYDTKSSPKQKWSYSNTEENNNNSPSNSQDENVAHSSHVQNLGMSLLDLADAHAPDFASLASPSSQYE